MSTLFAGSLVSEPSLVELVAHEDVVPVLEVAVGVVARPLVVAAELAPAVQVHLGARATGARLPRLPEVLRARQEHDPLLGDPMALPDLDRLLVGPQPKLVVAAEHARPDAVLVEPEDLHGKLEAPGDRLLLEVVPEAPVAEHLEEGEVPAGVADLVDVGRAEALLDRGEAIAGRFLVAAEVRLEGLHSGDREQGRGVLGRRDQRRRRHAQMASLLEEREICLANLAGFTVFARSLAPRLAGAVIGVIYVRRWSRGPRPARRP